MSKGRPYLEIIVTVAVMAFLVLVIAGGFDQQRNNDLDQAALRAAQ